MKSYKDLKVWQLNQECIKKVIKLQELLPKGYAFQHIWKQLFRALTSAGANIAEGQGIYEGKEFQRYIRIAIRSSIEADHWIATLNNNLRKTINELTELEAANIETIKMLKGLFKSIKEKRNTITL